jgi:serine-type D-Ala-D-Ala carboxypeptidase/endopeptidase
VLADTRRDDLRTARPHAYLRAARACRHLDDTPQGERWRIAAGHNWRRPETPPWHLAALAGAGRLHSTAADLLAFLRLHAAAAASPLPAAAAETARPRATLGRLQMGLGWLIVPPGGRLPHGRARYKLLLHEGGTGSFRSFVAVGLGSNAATVVLTNQACPVGRLGLPLIDALIHDTRRS